MDLKLIIGLVIVVIILYLIWSYFYTSIQVLMSFQRGDKLTTVKGDSIAQSAKNNYSFSCWVYIEDWSVNLNYNKNILAITNGTVGGSNVFQLYFDKMRNDLLVYVDSIPIGNVGANIDQPDGSFPGTPTCSISNFPIQSWVNIAISVYNRAIDIYLDGKLVKTCNIQNVADSIQTGSIVSIGGSGSGSALTGFSGYIASVIYNPNIISPQDAWNTYARGYSNTTFGFGNLFQRYKLQFAFLKDNSVVSSLTI